METILLSHRNRDTETKKGYKGTKYTTKLKEAGIHSISILNIFLPTTYEVLELQFGINKYHHR
jgi:hypothetical protein